jgi:MHS family proline/betaine transporter-like MFS transporter
MKKNDDKIVLAATIVGGAFEYFDFFCFIFLAPIISQLFFPKTSAYMPILFLYLTISASYLARPLGGIVFGHIADRYGRKISLLLSITLMVIPALIISVLPTYATIGIAATIILVISRIMQGLSMGNEYPSSITYISEKYKQKNRFFYFAWILFASDISIGFGAFLIHTAIRHSSPEFMQSIGWRIPFIFASCLAFIGIYLRKKAQETPTFLDLKASKHIFTVPLINLFKDYKLSILFGVFVGMIFFLLTSIFHIFLPSFLVTFYHLNLDVATQITFLGTIVMGCSTLIYAFILKFSDFIKVLQITLLCLCLVLVAVVTKFINLDYIIVHNISYFFGLIMFISATMGGIGVIFLDTLIRLFPTNVKVTGVGFSFNLANILGAGMTPLWTQEVMQYKHDYNMIILVCLIFALITLFSTSKIRYYLKY